MNRNSYKRSGIDRRKQNGISVRIFVGNGNRTTIRRQEDKGRIFFVDQYYLPVPIYLYRLAKSGHPMLK
jgi:hypothetical protein